MKGICYLIQDIWFQMKCFCTQPNHKIVRKGKHRYRNKPVIIKMSEHSSHTGKSQHCNLLELSVGQGQGSLSAVLEFSKGFQEDFLTKSS